MLEYPLARTRHLLPPIAPSSRILMTLPPTRFRYSLSSLRYGWIVASCLVAAFINPSVLTAQSAYPPIEYTLDFSDAINHYVSVTMTTELVDRETDLMMAVWTPGSYLVREYPRHIDRIDARDAEGRELECTKTRKNRWRVRTLDEPGQVTLRYRVYCDELSVRTNYVDRSYAVLNGAATFITIPERRKSEHRIRIELPDRWKRSAASMRTIDGDINHYTAESFDEVVDSPIVAGNVDVYPFEVAGVDHYLVNVNDRAEWDGEKATADLAKLVDAHHRVWQSVPYDRYYFINVIAGGGGGLEHDNCCLMLTGSRTMRDERSYLRWLSLASHEFFHTWNVRRLRPKALVEYDYENEVYTPSLWIAEGITSYYEDLLLVRAGLMDADDFLSTMGRQIRSVQSSEGRKVQSLRDSSYDAWIKFYRPAGNSDDTQISYYTKGAVVGLLLDARIRAASDNRGSLDDALRTLYKRHANGVGFTPEDFRAICSDVAGERLDDWFVSAVDSTDELDYQELADVYGLVVGEILPSNAPEEDKDDTPRRRREVHWIGVGESGSPASKAGISELDELIAINDQRIENDLESRLQEFEPGDPLKMLIARDGQIVEVLLTVGVRPRQPVWNLSTWDDANKEQESVRDNWLREYPEDPADEESDTEADAEGESEPDTESTTVNDNIKR